MKVWRSDTIDFTLDQSTGHDVGLSGQASFPIANGIPGVNATASIGALFGKRVANHYQFSRLEKYITNPTTTWINDSIDTDEVKEYIKRTSRFGRWKMYLISGIAIARAGAKTTASKSKEIALQGGVGLQVPVLAEAGPELSIGSKGSVAVTATHTTDFIWAIRLAKITNNGLQERWAMETVLGRESFLGKKATFSADTTKSTFDPRPEVAGEGLDESDFEVTSVIRTLGGRKEEQVHFITISDEGEDDEE
ncbi:hypothetical protein MMYC01_201244 [Madurella mycetomatis]|uniref:Uncharacterized protein n=1 Tax=Madurella mycetomatis TaxID=100816 RepID=A0A175WG57_9PEZI|nr:hypothetical protein MMYC01_201244 [Madurella mycetomatis]